MTDKMREEFEAWVKTQEWYFGSAQESLTRDEDDTVQYLCAAVHGAWLAWQASRAAVVVELPALHTLAPDDDRKWHGCRNSTIRTCARAIELAGLKVKP